MSDNKEKEFRICQVFNDLNNLQNRENVDGDFEEHFGFKWKITIYKNYSLGSIYPSIFCKDPQTGNWTIDTVFESLVGGLPFKTRQGFEFNQNNKYSWSNSFCIPKSVFSEYGTDGSVIIEYRLEVLYAASPIQNDTLLEIMKLSDFFDAKVVVRRCEEFLINHPKETLKFKLQMTTKYKLPELRKKCLAVMTKTTNFKVLIPEDSDQFDKELWKELCLKLVSLL
ncbi:unnamed protein product [Caenorhabditis nigoni]